MDKIVLFLLLLYINGIQPQIGSKTIGAILQLNSFKQFYRLETKAYGYSRMYNRYLNYTLFLPNDQVLLKLKRENKNIEKTTIDVKRFINSHMFMGFYTYDSLKDGQMLVDAGGNNAFVNKLYHPVTKGNMLWVQSIKVIGEPLRAINGITYKLDNYISSPQSSIIEYLEKSGNHFNFLQLISKQILHFQFPYGVTILAPFDWAFNGIPEDYRQKLHVDDRKARTFIRNHIISRPMCRQRLFHKNGWSRETNNVGKSLQLYQDSFNADASYINGAAVLTDIPLTDGFLYGITEALLPETTMNVMEVLRDQHCHTFLQHLIATGFMRHLDSLLERHTLFAPSDQAFRNLPDVLQKRLPTDEKLLKFFVQYHMVAGKYLSHQLDDKMRIRTLAELPQASTRLYLNIYRNQEQFTVQNSDVKTADRVATNGVVHILDRVIIPPTKTLAQIIESTKRFRLFRNLARAEKLLPMLNDADQYFTLFIPNNRAIKKYFNKMVKSRGLYRKTKNESFNDIILEHVSPGVIFLSPTNEAGSLFEIHSKQNGTLSLMKSNDNHFYVQPYNVKLVKQNIVAINGVVHVINRVLAHNEFYQA